MTDSEAANSENITLPDAKEYHQCSQQMLQCQAMFDKSKRSRVVKHLNFEINTRIGQDDTPQSHVYNIVERCASFRGGIDLLVLALYKVEGYSKDWEKLEQYLRSFARNGRVLPEGMSNTDEEAVTLTALVQKYLVALQDQFEIYEDAKDLIPLRMQQGKLEPTKAPPRPLRGDIARLKALLQPHYSPEPPPSQTVLEPDKARPEVSLEDFLKEKTRVALLGATGAGKSTTLRRLVKLYGQIWQHAPSGFEPTSPIPIFITLNQWEDPQVGLVEFLQKQIEGLKLNMLAVQLPELLKSGRVVLLLDGLNELPQLERDKKTGRFDDPRVRAIAELGERSEWREVQCVLSCRVKEFRGGPQWHDLHVLPLRREQVEAFSRAYYDGDEQVEVLVQNLLYELYESRNERKQKLQGLAEQPFYLRKLLAFYYDQHNLPDSPALLIEYTVQEALEWEIVSQPPRMTRFEANELQERLAYLAFNMTNVGRIGAVDKESSVTWLFQISSWLDGGWKIENKSIYKGKKLEKARKLWELAESANLLIETENEIQFRHQLFQEYFCVLYCKSQIFNINLLKRITFDQFIGIWHLWLGLDSDIINKLLFFLENNYDSDVRLGIVNALGSIGDSRAIESLISSLKCEEDFDVCDSIINALVSIIERDDCIIEPLLNALKDEDCYIRRSVTYILSFLYNDDRLVKPLLEIFQDKDLDIRQWAAIALGNTGSKKAIKSLLKFLKSSDESECFWAAIALGRIGDKRAIKSLIAALKNKDRGLRAWAALTLGDIGGSKAVLPLVESLKDEDVLVRSWSADALSFVGDKRAIESLIVALTDNHNEVRSSAAFALGQLSDDILNFKDIELGSSLVKKRAKFSTIYYIVVESLLNALKDEDSLVRFRAVSALGKIGNVSALPALKQIAENDTDKVRLNEKTSRTVKEAAEEAIEQIKRYQNSNFT
jgi:HEAT repeat protein